MTGVDFGFPSPQESPGFLFWRAGAAWQRTIRAGLAPLDLTHPQFVVLAVVTWFANASQPPTQSEVGELIDSDANTVSDTLKRLERKGLLARERHPDDGRARVIVLTAEGRETLGRAVSLVEAADRSFFADPSNVALFDRLATLGRGLSEPSSNKSECGSSSPRPLQEDPPSATEGPLSRHT